LLIIRPVAQAPKEEKSDGEAAKDASEGLKLRK